MKFANHRIWYHWGFGFGNARTFSPLTRIVQENIEHGRLKAEDESEFWYVLQQETARRARDLMNYASEVFGYPPVSERQDSVSSGLQREQLNAFVTILYSSHLLGDHTTEETSIIESKDKIVDDIFKSIDNLAGKSPNNKELAKRLKRQLEPYKKDGHEMLEALAKYFPTFFLSLEGPNYNYRSHFEKMGYKFRETEPSKGNIFNSILRNLRKAS